MTADLRSLVFDATVPTELRCRALDWLVALCSTGTPPVHRAQPQPEPSAKESVLSPAGGPASLPDELDDLRSQGGMPPILDPASSSPGFFPGFSFASPPSDEVVPNAGEGAPL
jgi:hypothetical protein